MTPNSRPAPSGKLPARSPELRPAAGWISRSLYNLAWYPALPFALAVTNSRGARRAERLGNGDSLKASEGSLRVWLHAASVGEIEAVWPIATGLLQHYPEAALIVTTMTATGRDAAIRRIPAAACRLAPLDHPLAVRRFLNAVAPDVVLIAEAELWPNYFIESRRRGARIAIVNGRLSDRSLKRYKLLGALWRAVVSCADIVMVQSGSDAEHYRALGVGADRIVVTGNTKFTPYDNDAQLHPALVKFAVAAPTLIAGSTAPGEERQIVAAYLQLRSEFPDLQLVLAPRHLERTSEIQQLLSGNGIDYLQASELKLKQGSNGSEGSVLLLDTLGDLRLLYRYGTLAFVGGSLFEGRGGQNLGEPAAAGVPVLFGPFHQKQQQAAQALLAHRGGAVVRDGPELVCAAARLLRDEPARREQAARAREVYESLAGGAARTLTALRTLIGPR
jgi:3-deoxy-D-manno-octulosonic-acid transferase